MLTDSCVKRPKHEGHTEPKHVDSLPFRTDGRLRNLSVRFITWGDKMLQTFSHYFWSSCEKVAHFVNFWQLFFGKKLLDGLFLQILSLQPLVSQFCCAWVRVFVDSDLNGEESSDFCVNSCFAQEMAYVFTCCMFTCCHIQHQRDRTNTANTLCSVHIAIIMEFK